MISDKLKEARQYEIDHLCINDADQPAFHMTGATGWINDPNGFSTYKGEYHLFYQYYPYALHWGPMHWGHVKTKDFVKWEYLPCAMAPDMEFDNQGCFSGSAIETVDGKHLLMYTGVHAITKEDGEQVNIQEQCIAIGDGMNYEKYESNPVITREDLPEGCSMIDFRDPKIWKEEDTYYTVVGDRTADGSGCILLFESKDAYHWKFNTVLDASKNELGKMWECPDFFALDGKYVLITDPQEMEADGLTFHPGNISVVLIGERTGEGYKEVDGETLHSLGFCRENVHMIDYGMDFYAPQTIETADGRRVMIAWMQNWSNVACKQAVSRYYGQMTLPRELHIKDGRMMQTPITEIKNYYASDICYKDVEVAQETNLEDIKGKVFDMTVDIRTDDNQTFTIKLGNDGKHFAFIEYNPAKNIVHIDRTHTSGGYDIVHNRDFFVADKAGQIRIRILMDKNSVELFVNDGEQAAALLLYGSEIGEEITFSSEGNAKMDVEFHEIRQEKEICSLF